MDSVVNFYPYASETEQTTVVPPPIGEALEDAKMGMIGECKTLRHNSVAQYIDIRPIFDIAMVEERQPGSPEII